MIDVEKSYTINQLMRFSRRELIDYIKNLERQRNQLNKVVDKLLENSTSHREEFEQRMSNYTKIIKKLRRNNERKK